MKLTWTCNHPQYPVAGKYENEITLKGKESFSRWLTLKNGQGIASDSWFLNVDIDAENYIAIVKDAGEKEYLAYEGEDAYLMDGKPCEDILKTHGVPFDPKTGLFCFEVERYRVEVAKALFSKKLKVKIFDPLRDMGVKSLNVSGLLCDEELYTSFMNVLYQNGLAEPKNKK